MIKPYRLAKSFRQVADNVRIEVIFEGEEGFDIDERLELKQNDTVGYAREVVIWGDDAPFCYARTIMPKSTYLQFQQVWDSLGEGFLGDHFLYRRADMQRSAFKYAQLHADSPVLARMPGYITKQNSYCVRRSLFMLDHDYPLLLTEAFLPSLPAYKEVIL